MTFHIVMAGLMRADFVRISVYTKPAVAMSEALLNSRHNNSTQHDQLGSRSLTIQHCNPPCWMPRLLIDTFQERLLQGSSA
jgi:hypothetical protein